MSESENSKPVIAGAICARPATDTNNSSEVSPPKQPKNLQGLLKFAMEATKLEDAPHESHFQPLDENRKRFLEQALNSLTIDVIEEITKQLKILEKVKTLQPDEDPIEYTTALDIISDYVCDIDTANDFHKIGGFIIIPLCLQSNNARIKSKTGNLLAELCQNNPYCQKVALESDLMPILLGIVENEDNVDAVAKAIYAISAIVRHNPPASAQFIQYRGVQIFREKLSLHEEKINTKICFLLVTLCSSFNDFKNRLIFNGYLPVLFSLVSGEPKPSHEHVLELIVKLIEDNNTAVNECKQSKYSYRDLLNNYLSAVAGKEEFQTQEELAQSIHRMIFP